jgi:hypothetical protein
MARFCGASFISLLSTAEALERPTTMGVSAVQQKSSQLPMPILAYFAVMVPALFAALLAVSAYLAPEKAPSPAELIGNSERKGARRWSRAQRPDR